MVFQDSTNLNNVSKYIVDSAGDTPYATIQAALDAANTAGGNATVWVREGTYTEDLTLYTTVNLVGATGLGDLGECVIDGQHTPPAAGSFLARNIRFESATNIFNSAVAGTTDIVLIDAAVVATNGYTFNLPNWTGSFACFDIGNLGTDDGFINNTGGATVTIFSAGCGNGNGNTMILSGATFITTSDFACPISVQGTATATFNNCSFAQTFTTAATATTTVSNSSLATGANQAITHGSANELSLSDVTIDTSNDPSVGGAGAGNILVGTITFLDNAEIAATLTLDRTTTLSTGRANTTTIEAIGEGAGAQNVIDIVPDVAIGAVAWHGINIDGTTLDPTAGGAEAHAINIDMSGIDLTNNPDVRGAEITMPAVSSAGCDAGIRVNGYGIEALMACADREAGFYTDSTLIQDADTTGFTAVDTGFSQLINIDNAGSTGGDFHAVNITATGVGVADIFAVGTDPEVGVIHQHTGVFAAVAQGWKENGGFTDTTAAFDNPGVNVTIFDTDDDYIYVGANAVFSQIRVILDTVATRDVFPIFEYSTVGPVWVEFDPIDATQGFTENGIISFTSGDLAAWAAVNVNGGNFFYVRIRRTRNNIGTIPIEEIIRILEPVEYYWNEDGEILAANVTANGIADTTRTQYYVSVYGANGVLDQVATLGNVGEILTSNGAGAEPTWQAAAGLGWSVEAGAAVAAAVNSGYIANRAGGVTFTIPTTAAVGSIIRICSIQGLWTIAQNAAESIVFGAFATTVGVGGSLVATNVGDTIEIVCTVADTTWAVLSSIGNITVN